MQSVVVKWVRSPNVVSMRECMPLPGAVCKGCGFGSGSCQLPLVNRGDDKRVERVDLAD